MSDEAAGAEGIVLLVHDDPILLATTQSVLKRRGYRVIACSTPEEALEQCKRSPRVRVVLTRLVFRSGGMSGIEVAERSYRICGATAVLTDSHDPALLHTIPGFSEHIFLQQPCSPAQLLGAVSYAWMCRRPPPVPESADPETKAE